MSFAKGVLLNAGATIPQIGLGTWKLQRSEAKSVVELAVKNGYRHIDMASIYLNQREIGEALKTLIPSVVKREELFLTSKLWNDAHQPAEVPKALDETLKEIGTNYLDLYLIHWPVAFPPGIRRDPYDKSNIFFDLKTSLVDTWKAMIELRKTGKVRNIGVSNCTIEHINGLIAATGVVPAVNQVEAHPLLPQDELVAYCREKNIHITAHSSLGNNAFGVPLLIENPTVTEVATKLGATEAQVLLAWGAYRGYSVIPKTIREDRLISNLNLIELTKEDYEKVSSIRGETNIRFTRPFPVWDIDVFGEPEEAEASNKSLIR